MSGKLTVNPSWISLTGQSSTYSKTVDAVDCSSVVVQVSYSDAAPAAKTFVDGGVNTTTEKITITAHGFNTGLKVAATTNGVLPAGLSATNYWVIKIDADTIQLASSLANAEAGTPVNITAAAGGGTHTLTPAAAGSNVAKMQKSVDGTNWVDVASQTVTIATSTGSAMLEIDNPNCPYVRVLYTPSAGAITLSAYLATRT